MTSKKDIIPTSYNGGIMKLQMNDNALVNHGEHRTFATESKVVYKFPQIEVNPVTKKLQQVID